MDCPSNFRFGDQFDPRSPYFEEKEQPVRTAIIPYDFTDGEDVSRRLHVVVGFTEKSGSTSELDDLWVEQYTLNGVALSEDEVVDLAQGVPEIDELRDIKVRSDAWSKQREIEVAGVDQEGSAISGKLRVAFTQFPPAEGASVDAADLQNIRAADYVYTDDRQCIPVAEFVKTNPSVQIDSVLVLRQMILESFGDHANEEGLRRSSLARHRP